MESTISFDLVSPEQLVFNDKAGMIIVPGKEGDMGVLSGHSKLLSSLRPGRVMVYGGISSFSNHFLSPADLLKLIRKNASFWRRKSLRWAPWTRALLRS